MLMISIVHELSYQPVVLAPKLSFFFCHGIDTALSNATAVLRSLIWLLLIQQSHLKSHLLQKYNESGADLFKDRNAFYALSEAFQNMLKDPHLSPVYFAVDALDECEQGLSDLIQLISTSLILSEGVKWLASSHPSINLSNLYTTEKLLELDAQGLEHPINAYIDYKLLALKERDGYDKDPLAKVSVCIESRDQHHAHSTPKFQPITETLRIGIESCPPVFPSCNKIIVGKVQDVRILKVTRNNMILI